MVKITIFKYLDNPLALYDEFEDDAISDLKLTTGTMIGGEELPVGELSFTLTWQHGVSIAKPDYWLWLKLQYKGDDILLYRCTEVKLLDHDADIFVYNITAQSILTLLEDITVPPVMYINSTSVTTALTNLFQMTDLPVNYTADLTSSGRTIQGYLPEQSAKERLQWLCFFARLRVITVGTGYPIQIDLMPVDKITIYQRNRVYYHPKVYNNSSYNINYRDYVYTGAQTTDISATDEWAYDSISRGYYIVTYTDNIGTMYDRSVDFSNLTLTFDNDIKTDLASKYAERLTIEASVLMDGVDLVEGDYIALTCYQSYFQLWGTLREGNIGTITYTFGARAVKADIVMPFAVESDQVVLTVYYKYGNTILGSDMYAYIEGDTYEVTPPQPLEYLEGDKLGVYCAWGMTTLTDAIDEDTWINVSYSKALEHDVSTLELYIIDVDEASIHNGVVTIE